MYVIEIDGNGTVELSKNGTLEISVPFDEAPKILEHVTGEKFEEIDVAQISAEVRTAFADAKLAYANDFPITTPLPFINLTLEKPSKWVYFYSSIDQPSRLAALSREKYALWIECLIMESLRMRDNQGKIAWLTRMVLECTKEGAHLQDILKTWPGRFLPSDIPENFLQRHGTFLKPGKVLKEICQGQEEVNFEVFSGYFKDEMRKLEPECDRVQVSDKPSKIYDMGGRFNSCMIGKPIEYFEIYDDIKECSIAYIEGERGELLARALLWENVVDDESGVVYPKVMDRIYFATNSELATMKAWAIRNGYIFNKTKQSLGHYDFYDQEMNKVSLKTCSVETDINFDYGYYEAVPYVDTFSWVRCGHNKLYAYYPGGECSQLTNTNGSGGFLADGNLPVCCDCGGSVNEDDAHWDDNGNCFCDSCWDEHFTYCDECEEWYPRDDVEHVHTDTGECWMCERCRRNTGATYEEWSGEYHTDMNEARLDGDIEWISDYRINNDKGHNWVRCEECGLYFDARTEGVEGYENMCDECLQKKDEEDLERAEDKHEITCPACHGDVSEVTMVWIRDWIENTEIQYLCPDCAKIWKGEEE